MRARGRDAEYHVLGNSAVWLPISSSKQKRARYNAKEFTCLQCAFRPFDSVAKEWTWCSRKLLRAVIFFSDSHHAFGPWDGIKKVLTIKRKQKLESNCSSKSNSPSTKTHSRNKMYRIPNPCRATYCALRLSSEKAQVALKFQYRKQLQHNQNVVMLI